jgi:hypothetical protein
MVVVRFRDGHELRLPLGADAFEAQGCLHVRDAWGITIESFETAELVEWRLESVDQAPATSGRRRRPTNGDAIRLARPA